MRGRKTRENKARVDWEFGESQTSSRPLIAPTLISAGKVQGTPALDVDGKAAAVAPLFIGTPPTHTVNGQLARESLFRKNHRNQRFRWWALEGSNL